MKNKKDYIWQICKIKEKEQQENILQSINEDEICKIQKEEFKSVNKN
jgi:hypothetical protein